MKQLVIAVDFDGTLCEYAFPSIGKQTEQQKNLLDFLIKLREKGHYLILWTNRGDNEKLKCLSEAIEWCKQQGLEFDQINKINPTNYNSMCLDRLNLGNLRLEHRIQEAKKVSGKSSSSSCSRNSSFTLILF